MLRVWGLSRENSDHLGEYLAAAITGADLDRLDAAISQLSGS